MQLLLHNLRSVSVILSGLPSALVAQIYMLWVLDQLGFYCRHPRKYRFTTLQSVPLFDIGMINCGPVTDLSIISNGVYRRWMENVIDESITICL